MTVDELVIRTQQVIWTRLGEAVMIGDKGPYLALKSEGTTSLEAMPAPSYYLLFQGNSGVQARLSDRIRFMNTNQRGVCVTPSFRSDNKVIVQYEPDDLSECLS